jgi:hypothetical protein
MVPTDIRYDGAMAELGQKRRFHRRPVTSGLPPQADLFRGRRHVSLVPMPEVAPYCSINSPAIAGSFDCIDGAVFTSAASIHPCHT